MESEILKQSILISYLTISQTIPKLQYTKEAVLSQQLRERLSQSLGYCLKGKTTIREKKWEKLPIANKYSVSDQ